MCRELVRTRGFAALLSDEVFADVDLETLQVRTTMHRTRMGIGDVRGRTSYEDAMKISSSIIRCHEDVVGKCGDTMLRPSWRVVGLLHVLSAFIWSGFIRC